MGACAGCGKEAPFTISCPLNNKTTCFKCHDRLCPRLNPKTVIDLKKRVVYFERC